MAGDPYPGVGQVRDADTQLALRLVWDKTAVLQRNTFGPFEGTLNPDVKPRLGPNDAGFIFYATDYNRRYRWTGSGWIDDAAAPPRFQVAWFVASRTPEPLTGWVRCNGSAVQVSTSTGNTEYFQTPTIPVVSGQLAWIRL